MGISGEECSSQGEQQVQRPCGPACTCLRSGSQRGCRVGGKGVRESAGHKSAGATGRQTPRCAGHSSLGHFPGARGSCGGFVQRYNVICLNL